jgi:hypothetical protein
MRVHFLLFILLTTNLFCSIGQNGNVKAINQAIDDFCECAEKAKDKNGFELCGQRIQSLDKFNLTKSDSAYILTRLEEQCGEFLTKFLGSPPKKSIKNLSCTFLKEEDIRGLNLRKVSDDGNSIKWLGDSDEQVIRDIFDYRELYSSDSLAKIDLDEMKKRTLSSSYKKDSITTPLFQSVEVYHFELFENYHAYQIYARKNNLICYLTIGTSRKDMEVMNNIVDKLANRVKNCK